MPRVSATISVTAADTMVAPPSTSVTRAKVRVLERASSTSVVVTPGRAIASSNAPLADSARTPVTTVATPSAPVTATPTHTPGGSGLLFGSTGATVIGGGVSPWAGGGGGGAAEASSKLSFCTSPPATSTSRVWLAEPFCATIRRRPALTSTASLNGVFPTTTSSTRISAPSTLTSIVMRATRFWSFSIS